MGINEDGLMALQPISDGMWDGFNGAEGWDGQHIEEGALRPYIFEILIEGKVYVVVPDAGQTITLHGDDDWFGGKSFPIVVCELIYKRSFTLDDIRRMGFLKEDYPLDRESQ